MKNRLHYFICLLLTASLTFTRQSGNEEILVAINFSNQPFFGAVELSGNYNEITPNIDVRLM